MEPTDEELWAIEGSCAECGNGLNASRDCITSSCYLSPDHYTTSSLLAPNLVESIGQPLTVVGEEHHVADRRPVAYIPQRNTIYVGQPAMHHTQLRNEFEIPRHNGFWGYVRPQGIDWLNGVGLPHDVEDALHERYIGNGWDV